jgi:hypothetical protein
MQGSILTTRDGSLDYGALGDVRFISPMSITWDNRGHCLWLFDKDANSVYPRKTVLKRVVLSPMNQVLECLNQVPSLALFPPGIKPIMSSYADIGCGTVETTPFDASLLDGHEQLIMEPMGNGLLILNSDSVIIRYDTKTKMTTKLRPKITPSPAIVNATIHNDKTLLIFTRSSYLCNVYAMNTVTCECVPYVTIRNTYILAQPTTVSSNGVVYWIDGASRIQRQPPTRVANSEYIQDAHPAYSRIHYSTRFGGLFVFSEFGYHFYDDSLHLSDTSAYLDSRRAILAHGVSFAFSDNLVFFFSSECQLIYGVIATPSFSSNRSYSVKKQRLV